MSLAQIATPGLAFEEDAHRYVLDGQPIPSVTQVLTENGLREAFLTVRPDVLERARQRGIAAHAAAHYYDEGDLDESTVDPVVAPYLEAWKAFRAERKVEVLALEQRVADPIWRFAGTIDRILRVPGVRGEIIADIKTGDASGVAYQTAAYEMLAAHLKPLITTGFLLERWAIHLHPDRAVPYSVTVYRDRRDREVFKAALTLTHERARIGRPRFAA